jgi:hypothetical protein
MTKKLDRGTKKVQAKRAGMVRQSERQTTVFKLKVPYACRKIGTDVLKIGQQGKGSKRKALPFGGTSRVTNDLYGGAKKVGAQSVENPVNSLHEPCICQHTMHSYDSFP